jgi:hypothetical protein
LHATRTSTAGPDPAGSGWLTLANAIEVPQVELAPVAEEVGEQRHIVRGEVLDQAAPLA